MIKYPGTAVVLVEREKSRMKPTSLFPLHSGRRYDVILAV